MTADVNVVPISDGYDRITSGNPNLVLLTQPVAFNFSTYSLIDGSFNSGPAIYEVEFLPGGTETVELNYNLATIKNTFTVPYLNLRVRNIIEYKRPVTGGTDSVAVKYPSDVTHINIPPVAGIATSKRLANNIPEFASIYGIRYYPDPRNLTQLDIPTNEFIGKYNIYATGYVAFDTDKHQRTEKTTFKMRDQIARPAIGMGSGADEESFTGLQGKYYMTGVSTDGKDTIDFINFFNGSGIYFAFDFANKGLDVSRADAFKWIESKKENFNLYTAKDFKPGDKVYLKTYGGALGMPMPGTKILAVVSPKPEGESYLTDKLMDGIQISPNPYYISHQAVKSPYDTKLYFSKLPANATIEIYTLAGDLITTLKHDEYNNDGTEDRHAVEIWDLLSKNRQRVQSQALIAVITAPNGAKTIKNFSVVVGGFRLIEQ